MKLRDDTESKDNNLNQIVKALEFIFGGLLTFKYLFN